MVTAHRPESIDNIDNLKVLLKCFEKLEKNLKTKFIFQFIQAQKILDKIKNRNLRFVKFYKPLEYLDFMKLMVDTPVIFTDSGAFKKKLQ